MQNSQGNTVDRPIFEDTVRKFNDWTYNSGGLVSNRDEYLRSGIDPEEENRSGSITKVLVLNYWRLLLKAFRQPMQNYEASGRHNSHDFAHYCHNDVNMLWLFDWLNKLDNPEFSKFCTTTCILDNGFDTCSEVFPDNFNTPDQVVGTNIDDNYDCLVESRNADFGGSHHSNSNGSVSNNSGDSSSSSSKKAIGKKLIEQLEKSNDIKRKLGEDMSDGWKAIKCQKTEKTIADIFDRIVKLEHQLSALSPADRVGSVGAFYSGEINRLKIRYHTLTDEEEE